MCQSEAQRLDDFAVKLAQSQAKRLADLSCFRHHEREDIEQELLLRLLVGLPGHDPELGHRNAFTVTLIVRASIVLVRNRRVCKRARVANSLDFEPTVPASIGAVDTACDVSVVLSALPRHLRETAECLKTLSFGEAASVLGIHRISLKRRVLRLRQRLFEAGLAPDGCTVTPRKSTTLKETRA